MKKIALFIVLIFLVFSYSAFCQLADHVVIAEIYAGGGNSGCVYTYDYIVLYNPTGSSVDVSAWSVQYSFTDAATHTWLKANLVGNIPAGSYYLIQLSSSGARGIPLPYYPEVIADTIEIKKGLGKVALVNHQTTFNVDPLLSDPSIIDFVGYGTADLWENSIWPSVLGDTKSIRRKTNGETTNYNYGSDGSGWDDNNNATDFYEQLHLDYIPNHPLSSSPLANHVVIAEVYGDGGPTAGSYRYDYVVLYNSSAQICDLSTWSLQYYNGLTWEVENLSGTISPDTYYLIQLADGGIGGDPLPVTPNTVGSTDIDATNGEVALVRDQVALTGANPLSTSDIVDFIGYGSASGYEGTVGPAPSPGSTSSIRRKDNSGGSTYGTNGSGWDSNDNSTDHYSQGSPVPLPVELTSFTAKIIGNTIRLDWKTETEVNNYGFEIQRMNNTGQNNSSDWHNVGFVEGHGNTNSPKLYSFIDDKADGTSYIAYRLKQVDNDGQFEYSSIVEVNFVPSEFALFQNFPNPFNPTTTIRYQIPKEGKVVIKIYNILGSEVMELLNEQKELGIYEVEFNADNLASGTYIYRIIADNFSQSKKMILLK